MLCSLHSNTSRVQRSSPDPRSSDLPFTTRDTSNQLLDRSMRLAASATRRGTLLRAGIGALSARRTPSPALQLRHCNNNTSIA